MDSVDSHSFFDISNVYPVGGESGDQAKSLTHSASCKRSRAGKVLFSELLVEANRRCFKGNIEAPRH